jgi:hypothetical protein
VNHTGTRYVTNLKEWELPRFTDLVEDLVEQLLRQVPQGLKRDALADETYDWLEPPIRELAQTAANETIEYWFKGLADGNNGRHPELCADLPFLEGDGEVDALTLVYAVDNEDGTRAELVRTTLPAAIDKYLDQVPKSDQLKQRSRVLAAELRALAERIEGKSRTAS